MRRDTAKSRASPLVRRAKILGFCEKSEVKTTEFLWNLNAGKDTKVILPLAPTLSEEPFSLVP